MSVLVIGASGYLGEYATQELRDRGHDVVAFDLAPDEEFVERAGEDQGIIIERGDMTTFADISDAITEHGVTDVLQFAYFGTPNSGLLDSAEENPYQASNTNNEGFNNVIEAARQFDLDSVVWASSTVVYGGVEYYDELGIETVDEESPTGPNSLYGACKVKNEYFADMYRQEYDLEIAGIRLPLIYGPERYPGAQPFIVQMFEEAASGGEIHLDDGETTWDLLYERDVGPLFADLLEAGEFDHDVYNVVGHTVTVGELAELAREKGHPDAEITVSEGSAPVLPAPLDDSRLADEFGYEPKYDAERAVSDYLDALAE